MKLNSYKRIISTDYPTDDQKLIEQLGATVNDGISALYFVLSNRLTFEDNFLATVKEVDVTTGATGVPLNRTSILLNNNNVVKGVLVIAAVNKTNAATYPT